MPIYDNVSNSWKNVDSVHINVNGAWKRCANVFVNVDGTWKPCFATAQAATKQGINYGMNYLSNVQVGSNIIICFNAQIWVISDPDNPVQGTVLRNTMRIVPSGAYYSSTNVWMYSQSNGGETYYVDIDRRYLKWVTMTYIATSTSPSFNITWPRDANMLSSWGFTIQDDRFEYMQLV